MSVKTYSGGCHCGAIRFDVDCDLDAGASRCNCTFCTMTGSCNVMVKPAAFRLLQGEAALTDYQGAPGSPMHHPFCKTCGTRCFSRGNLPEVGGDFVTVNANTLDGVDPFALPMTYWDGRHNNWDAGTRDQPWPVNAVL